MKNWHKLLKRQLQKAGIDSESNTLTEPYVKLFEYISKAYLEFEEAQYTHRRSFEISSKEMSMLKENLQREKEIVQSVMSDGLCVFDAFWKITSVNHTGSTLLYCEDQKLIARHYSEVFSIYEGIEAKGKKIDLESLESLFVKGEIYSCETGCLQNYHGMIRPIAFSINPLPLNENKFNGAVLLFRSIKEQLESESALKHAIKSAKKSNAAKTIFLANMSHEIRTPMNGIMGMLQLLQDTELSEKQKKYVSRAFDSAKSLLTLLGDILDFTKIEAGKISFESLCFNLNTEMESLLVPFKMVCNKKNIKLQYNYDNQLPRTLVGDPLRIKQVFNNLISNAIKFTPEGGRIDINIGLKSIEPYKTTIFCKVKDTGIGINKDAIPKIFDMFSQADDSTTRKYGGTGLGLAITKQLVELMGGEITVNSQEGKGCTFLFSLCLGLKEEENTVAHVVTLPTTLKTPASILLVEDNELNQRVAENMLTSLGCNVDIANSGESAIDAIQKKKYDLIFMDCQMPGMDGFKATQKIRTLEAKDTTVTSSHADLPASIKATQKENNIIVALTANALKETRERCLHSGMNDYLTKPVSYTELKAVLLKYVSKKA